MSDAAAWLAQAYPVPASEVARKDAVAHSLNKWRHLRLLTKYGLRQNSNSIIDDGRHVLTVDSETCALCAWYIEENCQRCPLAIARHGVPCDELGPDPDHRSPYHDWVHAGDPEPMIRWLERAQQWEQDQAAKP